MNFPKPITGAAQHRRAPHSTAAASAPNRGNQSGAVNASPFLAEPSNLTGEAGAPRTLPTKPDCASCGRGETALIPLSQGQFAIVDASDFEELSKYNWFAQKSNSGWGGYYAFRNVIGERGKRVHMHRQIMDAPDGLSVDHINRNGIDNRRSNLRLANQQQQGANRRVKTSKHPELKGLRGVARNPERKGRVIGWHSQIVVNGKFHTGKTRKNPIEAAMDYDRAAFAANGEFAVLNFPCRLDSQKPHSVTKRPACQECGRTFYGCICGCPEPEQECFRPAINRDPDWYRIEL